MPSAALSIALDLPPFSSKALEGATLLLEASSISGVEGSPIETWPDSAGSRNATQTTSGNQALLRLNYFNGKSALQFDGNDDFYSLDLSFLAGSAYTIFVVEARNTASGYARYFLGNTSSNSNEGLHLGYRGNTEITLAQYFNDYNLTIDGYSTTVPNCWCFVKGTETQIWKNNVKLGTNGDSTKLILATAGKVGRGFGLGDYYSGYLGAIAVYNAHLSDNTINDKFVNYFMPVYGIT